LRRRPPRAEARGALRCASRLGGSRSIGSPVAVRQTMRGAPSMVIGRSSTPRNSSSRTCSRVSTTPR
jgi:hypothetical protein